MSKKELDYIYTVVPLDSIINHYKKGISIKNSEIIHIEEFIDIFKKSVIFKILIEKNNK